MTNIEVKASGAHFAASLTAPANLCRSLLIRASATLSNETGLGVLALPVGR